MPLDATDREPEGEPPLWLIVRAIVTAEEVFRALHPRTCSYFLAQQAPSNRERQQAKPRTKRPPKSQ